MTNFILGTVAAVVVSVVGFTYGGDVTVDSKHSLTTEEKCEIYEQVMAGFVVSE